MGVGLGGDARYTSTLRYPTNILRWQNCPHKFVSELLAASLCCNLDRFEKNILHNMFEKLICIIICQPEKWKYISKLTNAPSSLRDKIDVIE